MAVDREAVLKSFPGLAWALDIPDVAKVLEDAVAGQWDQARLQAALQQTAWWQGTVPAAREYQDKLKTDPQSLNESKRQLEAKLWDLARTSGANLDRTAVMEISKSALQFGWNDQQQQDAIINKAREKGYQGVEGNLGQITNAISQFNKYSRDFYSPVDDQTKYQWATQVAAGEKKTEDFLPIFQQWGKSRYSYAPEVQAAIDGGMTVDQFFTPHKQEIAKYLEVSPDSIDLTTPQWQSMSEVVDPASGTRRLASVAEVGKAARKDPRWKTTQNGQAAGAKLAANITEMFEGR